MPRWPSSTTYPQPWAGQWTEWAQVHHHHQPLPPRDDVASLAPPARWYTVEPHQAVGVATAGPVAHVLRKLP